MLVRQLEEELRLRLRQPAPELQQQLEALYAENEHLQREIAILRDTIKVILIYLFSPFLHSTRQLTSTMVIQMNEYRQQKLEIVCLQMQTCR